MNKFVVVFVAVVWGLAVSAIGQNRVIFDNRSGDPALVKLIGPTQTEVDVPSGAKVGTDASAGRYVIKVRYGTPGNYRYSKGDDFTVTETATARSETTITLHKVVAGNYNSRPIPEEEFRRGNTDHTGSGAPAATHEPTNISSAAPKKGIAEYARTNEFQIIEYGEYETTNSVDPIVCPRPKWTFKEQTLSIHPRPTTGYGFRYSVPGPYDETVKRADDGDILVRCEMDGFAFNTGAPVKDGQCVGEIILPCWTSLPFPPHFVYGKHTIRLQFKNAVVEKAFQVSE